MQRINDTFALRWNTASDIDHTLDTCSAQPGCNARQGDTGHRMTDDYHPLRGLVLYFINNLINAVRNTQSCQITYRIAMAR